MNEQLSEHQIRSTCRELLASNARISGRHVRQELKNRFGAVGRTGRVFRIWQEELRAVTTDKKGAAAPRAPVSPSELERRVAAAEATAEANRLRAERAELREQAHQDRWASEIDQLRQQIRQHPKYAAEIRTLQEQVLRLTVELHAARRLLADTVRDDP